MLPPVMIDGSKVIQVADVLHASPIPPEMESASSPVQWLGDLDALANAYLAIVSVCHQTSPLGERRLEGFVRGRHLAGWDYLKERFLEASAQDPSLVEPNVWAELTPSALSQLYADEQNGLTLGRVTERTSLLNNLGSYLQAISTSRIVELFIRCDRRLNGASGFMAAIAGTEAFSDPLMKKSYFFMSLAISECGWKPQDPDDMLSPIDYHELRGHLRIGTIAVNDKDLERKVLLGLPITASEDAELRTAAQTANSRLAKSLGTSNSRLHYLLWNVFRACCPRSSVETHCEGCPDRCPLPKQYKAMASYEKRCLFATICRSATSAQKVIDPPFLGHYY
jgi:hypothetical protein